MTECWKRRIIGRRQHHCRFCGKAICGECWNPLKKKIPVLGFENPVNMCKNCFPKTDSVSHDNFGSRHYSGGGSGGYRDDPLSNNNITTQKPQTKTVEVRGFEGFDDEPLGMENSSTNANTLTPADEDLLGLALGDAPISNSKNSSDIISNPSASNISSNSKQINHGESIFSSHKINNSGGVIYGCVSYEKQWCVASLNDCSIRIFDISDLVSN